MSEIRRRKFRGKTEGGKLNENDQSKNGVYLTSDSCTRYTSVWFYFNILIGTCCAVYIGYRYAGYMKQLHENDMWFSNIQVCLLYHT